MGSIAYKNDNSVYLLILIISPDPYCNFIFSSPGQSPEELCTIPASALALASASTFLLKFFKRSYFLNHMMDLVHIWYNDRYRSKVFISNILSWSIGHKGQKLGHKVKS